MLFCESIWRDDRVRARARIVEARIAASDQKSFDTAMRRLAAPLPEAES